MAKFPEPPSIADLRAIAAARRILGRGTRVWRVYFQGGAHPTSWDGFRAWGPTTARFDHHLPPPRLQSREILYGAFGPRGALTALAEVFQASRLIDRTYALPALASFDTRRRLALLDLTGVWPTRAGASTAICSGPRPRARRWAQAIYDAWPDLDGLHYASSMNGSEPSVALFERAKPAVPLRPVFNRQLADPAMLTLLQNACDDLNYDLL